MKNKYTIGKVGIRGKRSMRPFFSVGRVGGNSGSAGSLLVFDNVGQDFPEKSTQLLELHIYFACD